MPSPLGRQATRGANVRKGVYGQVLKRSPYQRNNLYHRSSSKSVKMPTTSPYPKGGRRASPLSCGCPG